jgi:hypothetical protein
VFKNKEEVTYPSPQVNLIDDDYGIAFELSLFVINIKKKVCDVLKSFLSFKRKTGKKKPHNMLCLILNPIFKSLHLVSLFIGREKVVNIVEEYDKRTLYPMLLKCYHCLYPIAKYEVGHACETTYANCDLDIFQQIPSPSEPSIELITRETLIFRCYQVDSKDIKCSFQRWANHETMFGIVVFLVRQILGIVESQIEIERIFFFSKDSYKLEMMSFII